MAKSRLNIINPYLLIYFSSNMNPILFNLGKVVELYKTHAFTLLKLKKLE